MGLFSEENISKILQWGVKILIAVAIFVVGRWLIGWIRKRIRHSFERTGADKGLMSFTDSFLKIALYVVLILIVANNLGIELSSVTVVFAALSVGVSLALQESFSNFMGGILILILKPFTVGDYIVEDTNKDEGTVKEIQVFYTKLTTIDNRTVVIPNGTLANNSITNVTASGRRQLDLKIGISYSADLKKAKELLLEMLKSDERIMRDEDMKIFVDELGESAVVLGLRAWVSTEDYWSVRWDLFERIKFTFDEEGIEIPYNQLTLHVKEGGLR